MEPEKADLGQMGLSIKKSWQQLMEDWVLPEWEVAKRLFIIEDGYSSLLGIENQPFTSAIADMTRFSDRLSLVEWPFDFDGTVSQSFPENVSEQIPGRRGFFSSSIGEHSRNNVLSGQKQGPVTNEVSRNFPTLAEPAALSIIPQSIQEEGESLQPTIPENEQNEIEKPDAQQKGEAGKMVTDSRLGETSHAETEWFEGKNFGSSAVKNFAIPPKGQTINEKEQGRILPQEPMAGYPLEWNDGYDNPNLLRNNPIPGNTDNLSKTNTPFSKPSETESAGVHAENPVFLPPVKSLQNLGLWLKENYLEEPRRNESREKNASSVSTMQLPAFEKELIAPDLFKAEAWENSPIGFFQPNDINPSAPPLIGKQQPGIFENSFNFPTESSGKSDAEDFLQELTEHLNREFKRFYGA